MMTVHRHSTEKTEEENSEQAEEQALHTNFVLHGV